MAGQPLQIATVTVASVLAVMLASAAPAGAEVPEWVKMNAALWVDGDIDDDTYLTSIGWLIENDVIQLESRAEPTCDELKDALFKEQFALIGVTYAFISNPILFVSADMEPGDIFTPDIPEIPESCAGEVTSSEALLGLGLADILEDLAGEVQEMSGADLQCSLFCDSTGYEPAWAKDIGLNQAQSRCLNIISGDETGKDLEWCTEFTGYMLDQLSE